VNCTVCDNPIRGHFLEVRLLAYNGGEQIATERWPKGVTWVICGPSCQVAMGAILTANGIRNMNIPGMP
jgi:hypothetical protein